MIFMEEEPATLDIVQMEANLWDKVTKKAAAAPRFDLVKQLWTFTDHYSCWVLRKFGQEIKGPVVVERKGGRD